MFPVPGQTIRISVWSNCKVSHLLLRGSRNSLDNKSIIKAEREKGNIKQRNWKRSQPSTWGKEKNGNFIFSIMEGDIVLFGDRDSSVFDRSTQVFHIR